MNFANNDMSPLQFKSSIIRFCIVESKAFKRRLVIYHLVAVLIGDVENDWFSKFAITPGRE